MGALDGVLIAKIRTAIVQKQRIWRWFQRRLRRNPDIAEIVVFPYLYLSNRVKAEAWEVIPRAELTRDDAEEQWVYEAALGLLDLYKLRSSHWERVGCFARRTDGRIGESVEMSALRGLHRGVCAALLDPNPSLAEKDKGHQAATSDNALIYIHGVDPSGSVWVNYGVMVRAVVGGLQIGSDDVTIAPPPEVHVPFMHPGIDDVYLDALLQVLQDSTDESRRISRAIEWLDLAWRNTTSIDEDTRLVGLRAGFEVLLGVGDKSDDIRGALSALLDSRDAPRQKRSWTSLGGKERSEELTDLEWWFMRLSFLRNRIMHGSPISDAEYLDDGSRYVWRAEETLREAIKHDVANLTTKEILLNPLERIFAAAKEDLERDS
jgi:hypothetical protein